jgi:hypothetical protein
MSHIIIPRTIFESEYSLSRTCQEIVEFKLFLYKVVNHVLI